MTLLFAMFLAGVGVVLEANQSWFNGAGTLGVLCFVGAAILAALQLIALIGSIVAYKKVKSGRW